MILAHTNEHVSKLNRQCQRVRVEKGFLRGDSVKITDEQTGVRIEDRVYVGDSVVFTKNAPQYQVRDVNYFGIDNGTRGKVIGIGKKNNKPHIHVQLNDKEKTTTLIPTEQFKAVRLGYSSTNFKIQGDTVDHTILIAGGPMQDLPSSYVQFTRARRSTHIFTTTQLLPDLDNIEEAPLVEQMRRRPETRVRGAGQ